MKKKNTNKEVWKDLIGLEQTHQISSLGRLKNKLNNKIKITSSILHGYKVFYIRVDEKRYSKYLHRLLAEHFIENPNNYKCVYHIDKNKLNNDLKNLIWAYSPNTIKNTKIKKNDEIEGEEWKDIIGLEQIYQVSSLGRLKNKLNGQIKIASSILYKYKVFYIRVNKKRYSKYLHRLLAEHFIENPNDYKYVHHIDKNKLNNDLKNLVWTSGHKIIENKEIKQNDKIDEIEGEIWKDIKGFEDKYQISSLGRCKDKTNNKIKTITTRKDGTKRVHFTHNKNHYLKCLHSLLAEHFIENPNNYKYVCHIDGDKLNNKLENLQWVPCSRSNFDYNM